MSSVAVCVIDDIQLPNVAGGGPAAPTKAFGWAGYLLNTDALRSLIRDLDEAKAAYALEARDPVKRSPDDAWQKLYERRYGEEKGERQFKSAKKHALHIWDGVAPRFGSLGARLVACAIWPYSRTPTQQETLTWAFESLLQRVGLECKSRGWRDVFVIVDRPPNRPDPLHEVYARGYHEGKSSGWYSGDLRNLGFFGGLLLSATAQSPALQLADYVAGACRDFLVWCWTRKDKPRVKRTFGPLCPAFRKHKGKIDGAGFLIDPNPGFSVDDKITELMK